MSVTFYRLTDDEYDHIGRVADGVILEGEEALAGVTRTVEGADEEELIEQFNGPYLVAAIDPSGEPARW
ncbi:hypothetical protein [Natronorubrum sp. FCH18a]|uniref:hypothetical protein n=1 Tax=Natronorubrum sp. FCH18a TaxID=3447018 RepID=UPI003F50E840